MFEFATADWGPQALQVLLSSVDCNGTNLGIAKDTGVTEIKGLKGKRVGFVVGAPSLNQNALATLAFAGLTRNDVTIVEFSSFGAMWKGMVNNDVDAAFASTITAQTKEMETSPRGLVWPVWPHSDKAGWERVRKIAPFLGPHVATCGSAGLSPQAPKEMGGFPYPIFTAYASLPEDVAYAITKAMITGYDAYKDAAPGASGLGGRQADQEMGAAHPPRRGQGHQGGRRLERRRRGPQRSPHQAPGRAGIGMGRLSQDQSIAGQAAVPDRLDGGTQIGSGSRRPRARVLSSLAISQQRTKPVSTADPNLVILTGENPFIRLATTDTDNYTTNASFWRIIFCPAGPGHVLYLKSELTENRWRIWSDNIAMARWLQATVQGMLNAELKDTSIPVTDAEFSKSGDPRYFWTERAVARGEEVRSPGTTSAIRC